ncbi:MAG: glycogen debranching enzyme N-terminal domain-containing protein [Verrucomicrobia bacterium]|nr:glycogen debranching enzyme N-terminal domain-containing protein [Verrucomicrobiota bacterium]
MQPLVMTPGPGERLVRFVGDQLSFRLHMGGSLPSGWQARLRTNLGRGDTLRREIIHAQTGQLKLANASWRDVPMTPHDGGWSISFSLTEVGFFKAKAYAIDSHGRQHWPHGPDFGVSVHPNAYRTANTIYCAFPRMFGPTRTALTTVDEKRDAILKTLDNDGYAVIPPSGKLRDVIEYLPHIVDTLGCQILHLLPVSPTPTTYARFGRFGSPYAVQDLLAIDPALVVFDKRTTGVDQFRELTYATHSRGAKVFLDVVINHTGWGSTLQENHPEWYVRDEKGSFVSPGAWGTVWEDLAELDHSNPALWEHIADVFLEWCRRGVDGFRCDAGYKIPVPAWRYITARVQQEFPDTIFLLEGLGGSWEATENLLTEGAMQWAYSELFQNYSRHEISGYLDYALKQSRRVGLYAHYSETHDNDRLAKMGREWSLLRNRLCALSSVSGAFGFTCGVEWLAPEKLNVHSSRGLAWGNEENIVPELARLNRLLTDHPCFFDNATLTRLSSEDDYVYAISRISGEALDRVLVLVNTDLNTPRAVFIERKVYEALGSPKIDLLGQSAPVIKETPDHKVEFLLQGGECFCLAPALVPKGLSGDRYREAHAQSAWAITMISRRIAVRDISPFDWQKMAALVEAGPRDFLTAVSNLDHSLVKEDVLGALQKARDQSHFPPVVTWDLPSARRITVVPREHWLLIKDDAPFRAALKTADGAPAQHVSSIRVGECHIAAFIPGQAAGDAELNLERYATGQPHVTAQLRVVGETVTKTSNAADLSQAIVLLTNNRGGMARLGVDLGRVQSKYDCLLGANLHPTVPVDRHVFAKRVRAWVNADGFITPLDAHNLIEFTPGPPARWRFVASAGNDRAVEIVLTADMLDGQNSTVLHFERPESAVPFGHDLTPDCHVSLTIRVDIEDRNFHSETHHNAGSEHHFQAHTRPLANRAGFEFAPSLDRHLRVFADSGTFHPQPEWSLGVAHPIEATRGQAGHGDAFSPGWFDLPLAKGKPVTLTATSEAIDPTAAEVSSFVIKRRALTEGALSKAKVSQHDTFARQLALAVQAFVVQRADGKTVIAGYPWFLDWGRDSLIAARGLLAAGMTDEVKQLLTVFGRFEDRGTLPNIIHGEDASNRDTSDAPLWYGVVCEELAARDGSLYATTVDSRGRKIADILRAIATGYRDGTPNGIRMDAESGLIWSPSHFTWMDTNYPAGTPREGYPVEIQALWIRLLRQLDRINAPSSGESWSALAQRAETSFLKFFWLEDRGYLSDLLIARHGQSAAHATVDNALRSNCLIAVALGLITGDRAQRCADAALHYLVVPGALRSLAPLPVTPHLPVHAQHGQLLNNPAEPYWGRYEGDEDTRRKPAYHNGTAWTWTFPIFCEALAVAWNFSPASVAAAKHYLASMERLLNEGCLGQLPEITDGDAPHTQRGCDAQAWGASEALRVWKLLNHAAAN